MKHRRWEAAYGPNAVIARVFRFAWVSLVASAGAKVTYDDHVLPVFQQACLNCHNPDKTKGGLDLSTYGATLKGSSGGRIVEPGNAGSRLLAVVRQTAEPKMPPEGDKLAADQIRILEQWIEGGLLENAGSSARKPERPKFEPMVHSDPGARPEGPPPMPEHVLLEPPVVTPRAAAVHGLACSPWAPLLAITGQRQVLLYQTDSLELAGILPFPEGDPVSLAFAPDGRHLIVGGGVPGKSGVTVTFDVRSGARVLVVGREFDAVLASDIRPGFDRVVTGGPSRLLKFWQSGSGELEKSVKRHTDWITALDVSPDGVLLASGDRNGGLWVWEAESGNEFHTLRGHQAAITAVAFRADSNILASASEDGTLRFWEMNGGSEVRKIDAHPGGVTAFAFSRDGQSVSAGRDRRFKLWKQDFTHGRDLATGLPGLPTAVAVDGSAVRAFVADAEGRVLVIACGDGKMLGEIESNPPRIATRLEVLSARIAEEERKPSGEAAATLANLRQAHKRWTAAALLTRVLETRSEVARRFGELDALHVRFTEAAAGVTRQASTLNRERAGRQAAESTGSAPAEGQGKPQDENASEVGERERLVAQAAETLKSRETEFLEIRRQLDAAATEAWASKERCQRDEAAYQQALK